VQPHFQPHEAAAHIGRTIRTFIFLQEKAVEATKQKEEKWNPHILKVIKIR
jgi:hypothetical protein